MNSNKFTEFDMKIKNSDLEIKDLKPKNLTFRLFNLKKPRFYKMGLDSPGYNTSV